MSELTYLDSDDRPPIPTTVAVCPKCGAPLVIEELDGWEVETGRVLDDGVYVNCSTEPDIDADDWEEWHNWHWSTPYIDWLPIRAAVYQWFDARFRIEV